MFRQPALSAPEIVPRAGRGPARGGARIRSRTSDESRLKEDLARAERALERATAEIAALRERLASEIAEREDLVTIVTHELRTPLTVIAGFHKLLLSERVGPLTPEQRRFLEESNRSCLRLDSLVENLVDAARQLAQGGGGLDVCEASLESSVRSVVELLGPVLAERDVRVEVSFGRGATRARFHPLRIEHVLSNVIGNAARFATRGGRIEVATRPEPAACPRWIEVSVTDDGPGVAPEDRERIFRPWVRAGGQDGGGLGLGLSICKRIVEAHGGTITVADAAGGGSRFSFTLPAGPGPEPAR
jgi:signal transduction histidine kinase